MNDTTNDLMAHTAEELDKPLAIPIEGVYNKALEDRLLWVYYKLLDCPNSPARESAIGELARILTDVRRN